MPNIIIASCFQETNSFNPNPTIYSDFSVFRGQALLNAGMAEITQACWEQIAGECLDAIEKESTGADALYFAMHGAMAVESETDPEGYLLEEVRNRLGTDIPIVVSLDMHGTITRRMLQQMDGVAILHTYPHIDWFQLGERTAVQLLRILDGACPVIGTVYTPTMVRGDELKTATGVFGTFIRHCKRLEESDDVLGAGIMLGHPPTDVPEQGSRVIIVTDNNRTLAEKEALALGRDFWAMRKRMQCVLHSVEEAIEIAQKSTGPVIFSDAADATSSGATGASNVILKGLLESNYQGSVLFPIRDALAVERAFAVGIGSTITLPLGGTVDFRFTPIEVEATVELLSNGRYIDEQGEICFGGPIAVLRTGSITIVVSAEPAVLCDYSMYFGIGQDPRHFDLVIIKLPHTPHEQYDAWAVRNLTIDVPGAASPNIKTLNHQLVSQPIYPLDEEMDFTPQVEIIV
ncbi:M81 family metallopeptidase [Chloroflexi bacterium TSY]|nr:M81 family metallopeptidase [Chloroflexi bacterium TSY]